MLFLTFFSLAKHCFGLHLMTVTHTLSYENDPNHWNTLKSAVLLTSLLMLSWHNTSFATAGGIFVSKSPYPHHTQSHPADSRHYRVGHVRLSQLRQSLNELLTDSDMTRKLLKCKAFTE